MLTPFTESSTCLFFAVVMYFVFAISFSFGRLTALHCFSKLRRFPFQHLLRFLADTVGIKSSDFIKFLKPTGHDPVVLNFEG